MTWRLSRLNCSASFWAGRPASSRRSGDGQSRRSPRCREPCFRFVLYRKGTASKIEPIWGLGRHVRYRISTHINCWDMGVAFMTGMPRIAGREARVLSWTSRESTPVRAPRRRRKLGMSALVTQRFARTAGASLRERREQRIEAVLVVVANTVHKEGRRPIDPTLNTGLEILKDTARVDVVS